MFLLEYPIPLEECVFLRRYKRFFVDVCSLNSKKVFAVHCANSGSMKSCLVENATAHILDSHNSARKLRYSLELLDLEDGLACLNTMRANQFVYQLLSQTREKKQEEFFLNKNFPYQDFAHWDRVQKEVRYDASTRFDFCLTSTHHHQKCWIEVKSVSLKNGLQNWAFPDAVTRRGQKHLVQLMHAKRSGSEAWLFFVLMRGSRVPADTLKERFCIADKIDASYGQLYLQAKKQGVKVGLVIPEISLHGFGLRGFFHL
jgi:sugar fermentation stimulation protein A